jgi:uncharacterized protein (UPF0264 family)
MTQLLVSVRSAVEAEAALAGGAALIDVKEPAHGALGRAAEAVIAEVVRLVAGRTPVSAALGELRPEEGGVCPTGLAFCKFGLEGCSSWPWQEKLGALARQSARACPRCRVVAVAYADGERAGAPRVEEVVAFSGRLARQVPDGVFLLDTWSKDGSTLLDWLSVAEISRHLASCRAAGVRVALAGSLGLAPIERLLPLRPDWIAVRGAACAGGRRGAAIDVDRVRRLVELISARET